MQNSIFRDWSIGKWIFNILIVLLTIAVLSLFINPVFATGYIIMLIVHECGHMISAKSYGAQVRFGGFTPFGAYIQILDQTSIKENAVIAMSGPLCGLLNALIYFFIFSFMKDQTFLWLSFFAGIVSLMNLMPLNPFDGGKVISGTYYFFPLLFIPFLIYSIVMLTEEKWLIYIQALLILYIILDVVKMHRLNRLERIFHIEKEPKAAIFFIYLLVAALLAGLMVTMTIDFKNTLLPQIIIPAECEEFIELIKNFFAGL